MASFLAERMYKPHLNIYQCVILAAYILFQAKEHVEGCGGDSHIVVLRDSGSSGLVDWYRIEAITELLKSADIQTGELLIDAADLTIVDARLRSQIELTRELIEAWRTAQRGKIDEWEAVGKILSDVHTDFLGLPIPEEEGTE
jgi:hypothetical protein